MKTNFNSHILTFQKTFRENAKSDPSHSNEINAPTQKSARSSPQPPIIQKTVNHEISPPPSNKHSHYPHPRIPIKLIHTRPTFTPPRSVDPFLSAVRATLSTVGSSRLSSIRALPPTWPARAHGSSLRRYCHHHSGPPPPSPPPPPPQSTASPPPL